MGITSIVTLREAIAALGGRREEQEKELAGLFRHIYDSFKPVNILKTTLHDLAQSSEVRHDVLNTVIGVVSGYLARKLFVRSQQGLLKKIFGAALQFGITILIRKKGDTIKQGGLHLLHNLVANHGSNGSRSRTVP